MDQQPPLEGFSVCSSITTASSAAGAAKHLTPEQTLANLVKHMAAMQQLICSQAYELSTLKVELEALKAEQDIAFSEALSTTD